LGLKVGVLDADIYGPSLPKLLAIKERPETAGGTRLKPIQRYGMPVMSIGFLVEEETPMIWRGPMVMSRSRKCCARSNGAISTLWWSTCRPAPATPN
jgi:Mrp family chromosome partitioning ATPase